MSSKANHRILVVDDESSVLITLVANLELEGFEVVEAESGARALELIDQQSFDLVLSDVRMPGMDGVALLAKIRERHPVLPVVLMTAFALENALATAIHSGVFTILPKPFDIDHLVAVLAIAVRQPIVLVVDRADSGAASAAESLNRAGVRAQAVVEIDDIMGIVGRGEADVCVVELPAEGASGAELMEQISKVDPAIVCIAVSGQALPEMFSRIAAVSHTLLRRPLTPEALLKTIVEARRGSRYGSH